MGDLADSDWKVLLGADYKAKMVARDRAAGVTDATRAAKSKADMLANMMLTALGFAVVALVIFGTNFYSVSAPFSSSLATVSGIVALVSLAVAAYAWRNSAT